MKLIDFEGDDFPEKLRRLETALGPLAKEQRSICGLLLVADDGMELSIPPKKCPDALRAFCQYVAYVKLGLDPTSKTALSQATSMDPLSLGVLEADVALFFRDSEPDGSDKKLWPPAAKHYLLVFVQAKLSGLSFRFFV